MAVTILVLVLIGSWGIGSKLILEDRPATIMQITGTVLHSPAGESQWSPARPGLQLDPGDQLLTLPDHSQAVVTFDDGDIGFRLEADTLVTMTARWNALTRSGSGGVYLSQGVLEVGTRAGGSPSRTRFRIETPVAVANLEGTHLIVQVLKVEQTTRISSLDGNVRVRAKPAQAVLYRPGDESLNGREAVVSTNETLIVYHHAEESTDAIPGNRLGRVADPETGKGLEGMVVQVASNPALYAQTDAEGYFEVPGSTPESELVLAGTTSDVPGDWELVPQVGQVSGQVEDADGSQAIQGVRLIPVDLPWLVTSTGAEGEFALHELPAGSHTLVVVAEGYLSQIVEVTIQDQVRVSLPTIRLVALEDIKCFLPIILDNYEYQQYP